MSARIKKTKLKEYLDEAVPLKKRIEKINEEIENTKKAIIEANAENKMLARSLRKNLATLLTIKSQLEGEENN